MELRDFAQVLTDKCALELSKPVVLGLSGGPDSLCLLHLLWQLRVPVIAGHINHGLRAEAEKEARQVTLECQNRGVLCLLKSVDVRAAAKNSHQTIEEAGRKVRYRFLFQLAQEHHAQAVLVAHNADDQVETVLMHLLRGSGLSGLRGMDYRQLPNEWSGQIPLARPLLGLSKPEVLAYCREAGLEPSFDRSNDDTTYFRNRLRLELVPYLQTYNPNIRQGILNMADVLREEDEFLHQKTLEALGQVSTESGDGYCVLDRERTVHLPAALLRRVFFMVLKKLAGDTPNIGFDQIDSAVRFLTHPTRSGAISLVAGVRLFTYRKKTLVFVNENRRLDDLWPQLAQEAQPLKMDGQVLSLNGAWKMEVSQTTTPVSDDPWRAVLDAGKLDTLELGKFQPGDRFSPLGMGGKALKLGDYWTNEGLSVLARRHWPLLRGNGKIAWVPGFTIGEEFKVTENTRKVVSLRVYKGDKD